jgi:hypothetical protein
MADISGWRLIWSEGNLRSLKYLVSIPISFQYELVTTASSG